MKKEINCLKCYLILSHVIEEDAASKQQAEIDGKPAIIKVSAGFKCSLCGHVFSLRGLLPFIDVMLNKIRFTLLF